MKKMSKCRYKFDFSMEDVRKLSKDESLPEEARNMMKILYDRLTEFHKVTTSEEYRYWDREERAEYWQNSVKEHSIYEFKFFEYCIENGIPIKLNYYPLRVVCIEEENN